MNKLLRPLTLTRGALGSTLHPDDRRNVLAFYTNRFTGEHRPSWIGIKRPDGRGYPLQFANDADWLANTWFAVKKDGRLDLRVTRSESYPTWPDNPELRREKEVAA